MAKAIQDPAPAVTPGPEDELLLLPEVCQITRRTEATERWLRHMGKTDYLFKRGRRLAAWKKEVLASLEAEREADRNRR